MYPNNTFNNDITTYQYNALDLLTRVVDAQNNSTIIHYDSLGRKTDMTDPDMGRWDYAYDANGNLIEQGEANYVAGQRMRVHFDYDALDRLTLKSYPNGNGTAASYFYDVSMGGTAVPNGKGQRTAMLSGNFTTRFNYDQRGRMNQAGYAIQDRTTYTMNWVYDAADRITSVTYPDYELVSYAYDPAWRPVNAYTNRGGTGGCYVCNAHYTALDQPQDLSLNGQNASNAKVRQNWTYDTNSQRLNQLTVTNLNTSAIYFNRSYGYDNVGNVNNIHSNLSGGENQTFGYDELDRLTGWSINGTQQEGYTYNKIGNLLTKGNTTYTYGDAQPHQVISTSGGANNSYTYDANGNMLTGAGRTITWNANNQPTHVTGNSQDEVMAYDADGERAERTRASGNYTTYYIGGLVEADWQSTNGGSTFQQITQRFLYTFNGQVVAQRTIDYNTGETLTYLHGDHLGSASLATDVNGNNAGQREFGPWGNIRTSNLTQTRIAYTGQLKDDSNLLYYHARMYDPSLGRFLSADSIVPGAADSNASADLVGQAEKMNLTVDFHETGFASALDQEINVTERRGFYFQLNKGDQQRAKNPDGPMNSQALNRYSYVLDNPLRYTDPSGHRYEHELAEYISLIHRDVTKLPQSRLDNALKSQQTRSSVEKDIANLLTYAYNLAAIYNDLSPQQQSQALVAIKEALTAALEATYYLVYHYYPPSDYIDNLVDQIINHENVLDAISHLGNAVLSDNLKPALDDLDKSLRMRVCKGEFLNWITCSAQLWPGGNGGADAGGSNDSTGPAGPIKLVERILADDETS